MSIYKYREDYKPYIVDDEGELKQIEEEVVELTNFVLDYEYNLIAFQFHLEGLRAKSFSVYLNSFFENNDFEIVLEKIYVDKELNNIIKSNRILSINTTFLKNGLNGEQDTSCKLISTFLDSKEEEEVEVTLSIKNQKRKGNLSGGALKTLLTEMMENLDEDIKSIEVTYKDENGRSLTSDIKKLREEIYFDILKGEKNVGWEFILDSINENYANYQTKALPITDKIKKFSTEEEYSIKEEMEE